MKRNLAVFVIAVLIIITSAGVPFALAAPDIPSNTQVVSGGRVGVNVNGAQQTFTYQVYQGTEVTPTSSLLAVTTTSEYICGLTVKNQFGGILGRLEAHVFASFSPIVPIGWTLYSGSYTATSASPCCSWNSVTNPPYVAGGYGNTNTIQTAIANGNHVYLLATITSWHVQINFSTSGSPPVGSWNCSGGPGRLSPPG